MYMHPESGSINGNLASYSDREQLHQISSSAKTTKKARNMQIFAATVLMAVVLSTAYAVPNVTTATCELEHQRLIRDILTLRKNCDTAVFYDCCQIKAFVPAARSTSYKIERLCLSDGSALNFEVNKAFASCDMDTDGGGWMVIQRRSNTSMDFNRNWTDYENGFGDLNGDFWYGLKKIHCLSAREELELRIELGYGGEPEIVWTYQKFTVEDSSTNYRLTVGEATGHGDTRNTFGEQSREGFSTRDKSSISSQCGKVVGAGGWYTSACNRANLNGPYEHSNENYRLGWHTSNGYVHYTHVQMKVRPHTCSPRASQLCA